MTSSEALLFWLTTGLYVTAFIAMLFGLILGRKVLDRAASALLVAGLAAHSALVLLRWVLSQHPPVGNRYELNISGTWIAMIVMLIAVRLVPRTRPLLIGTLPVIFLALGLGVTSENAIGPLSVAYDSPWLAVHVVFAFLAFGCFALSFGAAAFYLLEDSGVRHRFSEVLPEQSELDAFCYRMIAIGFILEAVMIVTGAIWANNLWGSYWSWDPVETWSLISLLVYALYLHLYGFRDWRGRRAAIIAVAGLLFVIISFWGVQLVAPTVHDFNRF